MPLFPLCTERHDNMHLCTGFSSRGGFFQGSLTETLSPWGWMHPRYSTVLPCSSFTRPCLSRSVPFFSLASVFYFLFSPIRSELCEKRTETTLLASYKKSIPGAVVRALTSFRMWWWPGLFFSSTSSSCSFRWNTEESEKAAPFLLSVFDDHNGEVNGWRWPSTSFLLKLPQTTHQTALWLPFSHSQRSRRRTAEWNTTDMEHLAGMRRVLHGDEVAKKQWNRRGGGGSRWYTTTAASTASPHPRRSNLSLPRAGAAPRVLGRLGNSSSTAPPCGLRVLSSTSPVGLRSGHGRRNALQKTIKQQSHLSRKHPMARLHAWATAAKKKPTRVPKKIPHTARSSAVKKNTEKKKLPRCHRTSRGSLLLLRRAAGKEKMTKQRRSSTMRVARLFKKINMERDAIETPKKDSNDQGGGLKKSKRGRTSCTTASPLSSSFSEMTPVPSRRGRPPKHSHTATTTGHTFHCPVAPSAKPLSQENHLQKKDTISLKKVSKWGTQVHAPPGAALSFSTRSNASRRSTHLVGGARLAPFTKPQRGSIRKLQCTAFASDAFGKKNSRRLPFKRRETSRELQRLAIELAHPLRAWEQEKEEEEEQNPVEAKELEEEREEEASEEEEKDLLCEAAEDQNNDRLLNETTHRHPNAEEENELEEWEDLDDDGYFEQEDRPKGYERQGKTTGTPPLRRNTSCLSSLPSSPSMLQTPKENSEKNLLHIPTTAVTAAAAVSSPLSCSPREVQTVNDTTTMKTHSSSSLSLSETKEEKTLLELSAEEEDILKEVEYYMENGEGFAEEGRSISSTDSVWSTCTSSFPVTSSFSSSSHEPHAMRVAEASYTLPPSMKVAYQEVGKYQPFDSFFLSTLDSG